jgi:putative transposase
LLAEKGISVSYESIRLWCNKIEPHFARRLRRRHQGFGNTFFFDEVFVTILGGQHYLWRDVDQDGEVVDMLLQFRRDGWAAKHFFKCLIKKCRGEPGKIVTDKLCGCDGMIYVSSDTQRPFGPSGFAAMFNFGLAN